MHKMMYINDTKKICERDGVFYFVRRVPIDVLPYHSSNRISIRLKTKSASAATRACKSINQRLLLHAIAVKQAVKRTQPVVD